MNVRDFLTVFAATVIFSLFVSGVFFGLNNILTYIFFTLFVSSVFSYAVLKRFKIS